MPISPSLFDDPAIAAMQLHRTRTIATVLDAVPDVTELPPVEAAFAYAVAHHRLEGAERAARQGDQITLGWYRTFTVASRLPTHSAKDTAHPLIVLAANPAEMVRSGIADTPYVLIGPDIEAAPDILMQLVATAVGVAETAGFAHLVQSHAPIVALLQHKTLGQTLDSWTISRLPGTVFTDYTNSTTVLARDLIHEAGHNWLNDALTTYKIKISDTATFYSPWKTTERPAFGFLHACWAFPLTMLYTAAVLDEADSHEHDYLDRYLQKQRQYLDQTRDNHGRALELITDPQLAERLHLVHDNALRI